MIELWLSVDIRPDSAVVTFTELHRRRDHDGDVELRVVTRPGRPARSPPPSAHPTRPA